MNSDKIIYVLITFNCVLICMCAWERNWHKVAYWGGALMINSSILWGMK